MKNTDQTFHKNIVKFIDTNSDFFADLLRSHTKAQTLLRGKLDKLIATITMEDLDALENPADQQTIIDLGIQIKSLHKAAKKKFIAEYIITHLNLELMLCRLSKDARDFFYIKQGMGSTQRFEELIERYHTGKLGEFETLELYEIIRDWQRDFNKQHLKRYAQILFGMSYNTLDAIRQECFKNTYATYRQINVRSNGGGIIRKDGTQVED